MNINEEGYTEDFLGVNIDKLDRDTYPLSQTKINNQIVSYMGLSIIFW